MPYGLGVNSTPQQMLPSGVPRASGSVYLSLYRAKGMAKASKNMAPRPRAATSSVECPLICCPTSHLAIHSALRRSKNTAIKAARSIDPRSHISPQRRSERTSCTSAASSQQFQVIQQAPSCDEATTRRRRRRPESKRRFKIQTTPHPPPSLCC